MLQISYVEYKSLEHGSSDPSRLIKFYYLI